eukprot:CAMPEP_0185584600 /NCGR_PEP_ID=MMETSP0434-20130131/33275_1 /TAXON_ID=626734 ORGANISM="Favella taraikaensis, Strain Fe Narragansett Bay" /NCGR_SAMPLE_ID=MMETSP0434 /ASSEMBLY_ACC=CAM_ASM_000379 /LENGTH=77 /DNA_ID=CAMNT_0028204449 /DNA_START=692 /DNA_END=922 /DNA_ORIENTATION=-
MGDAAAGADQEIHDVIGSVAEEVREEAYLTLLAIFILLKSFKQDEFKWILTANKAKSWLESVGVSKPSRLIKKFQFE